MGTALVTGATSGIGEEFCWQLAAGGHDVILVARRKNLLEDIANKIEAVAGVKTEVIVADLADPDDLNRVAERLDVERDDPSGRSPVGLLVNNAGFGLGLPFLDNPLSAEVGGLDVMVKAVMVLSHHAGRAMRERGRGAILNVASVAADTGMGTYSAHKAWVRSFTEGLAIELEGTGVTATVVCPGMTRTPFHEAIDIDLHMGPDFIWLDSPRVVRDSLDAVRRGKIIETPSLLYKVTSSLARIAPRALVRTVVKRLPHI